MSEQETEAEIRERLFQRALKILTPLRGPSEDPGASS
jgi:hypothetical protein